LITFQYSQAGVHHQFRILLRISLIHSGEHRMPITSLIDSPLLSLNTSAHRLTIDISSSINTDLYFDTSFSIT